ncbi:thiamine diphosphokinase [Clostridium sp. Cult2]|uniref:thiamine diphosphokinase n=1 Tax=Clostridium sp. Cult2 TaxID=2079003 RepID=UPI001F016303|nr:thiamine diphosphokinase [Clostridium sp. Cult2]
MKALLVLNGRIEGLERLERLGKESDFILCADGGTNYCIKASLMPNVVIGDLDSISKDTLNQIYEHHIPIKKFPVKKDKTDAELSIDYLISEGFKDITIVGAIGSRIDHTLANVLLLTKLNQRGINGRIVDNNNTIYLVDRELVLNKEEDSFLSIIPITNSGVVVTLKGFEYELESTVIGFGSTFGVSNKIIKEKGHILIHEGQCLAIVSKD